MSGGQHRDDEEWACANRSRTQWLGARPRNSRARQRGQQAVLAPITKLFDAMAKRDAAAFKKQLLSGGTTVLMREGKPTQMTFEQLTDLVGKPGTRRLRSEFMIRLCGWITIWRWCGLLSSF